MYSRILVPLDGKEYGETAVRHAGEIGQHENAEIVLFQVVQNPIRSVPIAAGQAEVTKASTEEAGKAAAYLEKLAAPWKAKGIKVRCEVEIGEAPGRILDKADREGADLIVMTTHHEGDLHKLIKGSVAEKVLHGTKRPVLLVKP